MHERSRARRQALQVLYQREITGDSAGRIFGNQTYSLEDGEPDGYCRDLATGVEEHLSEIDETIGSVSENWSVSRMPLVDRNILRIAAFELMHEPDVPPSVAINEAVELAKTFGGEDSSKFVNGVLGRVAERFAASEEPKEGGGDD
ncbi:MAG: transcription antitermination factor NusB [Coriobacteriales bacterium]|nr:transcription antitermination factor NusB [Coriobacteriales bacterium]